jgi:hypothetical protein
MIPADLESPKQNSNVNSTHDHTNCQTPQVFWCESEGGLEQPSVLTLILYVVASMHCLSFFCHFTSVHVLMC